MYITLNDLYQMMDIDSVAQLSNDSDSNTVNETVVTQIISDSSDLIDSYLRGSYTLPLVNTSTILKGICIDLTKYGLYKRRNKITEDVDNLYKKAISLLRDIQKGITKLSENITGTQFMVSYTRKDSIYVNDL